MKHHEQHVCLLRIKQKWETGHPIYSQILRDIIFFSKANRIIKVLQHSRYLEIQSML